jgi:hypothetical protein
MNLPGSTQSIPAGQLAFAPESRECASIIGQDGVAAQAGRSRIKDPAMNRNRLRLPRPAAPEVMPGAFVLYPILCVPFLCAAQALWIETLYRRALEDALEVARPSLPERDLLGVWN